MARDNSCLKVSSKEPCSRPSDMDNSSHLNTSDKLIVSGESAGGHLHDLAGVMVGDAPIGRLRTEFPT